MPAAYKVEITPTAEADIADIWDSIAQDSSEAATRFILRIEEQITTLEQFPERCASLPENELLGTGYRHLLFGNYRTIFKIIGSRVIIMRVLHGARLFDQGMLAETSMKGLPHAG